MAERDVSGKTVFMTGEVIKRVRSRMQQVMPYGPMRQYLSQPEQRQMLQQMDPIAKQQLAQRMGDDEWRKMLQDLYGE